MLLKFRTLFLLFLLPFSGIAQSNITGKILNLTDKQPISNASVFLNNASVGTASNSDGAFVLKNVKNGQYELIVSVVGFETFHQTVLVNNDINLGTIEVVPKSIALREVKIMSGELRERYYQIFKQRFLGTTDNAKQCQILNPDILDINYNKDKQLLTVSSDDFLEIENKALGYKLKYLLTDFIRDGQNNSVFFEGLVTFENLNGSTSQQKRWKKNRLKAYEGSQMHFLRSLIGMQLDEDGFRVLPLIREPIIAKISDSTIREKIKYYRKLQAKDLKWSDSLFYWVEQLQKPKVDQKLQDTLLKGSDLIKLTDKKGIYALGYKNCLWVMYTTRHDINIAATFNLANAYKYPWTIITFKSPHTFFDVNGGVLNPESIFVEGNWSNDRIADSVPLDYDPLE